jgi:group I intron endonuclease
MFYLYKIVNSINSKLYIGITKNPKYRWNQHLSERSNCTKLKRALQKYGPENFQMEILCVGEESYIIDLEPKAIALYDSVKNGYNLMHASSRGTLTHHEESKKKTSESLKDFYKDNQNPLKGTKVSKRSDDKYIFVKGFWFPNTRTCQQALGITDMVLYKWKREGTLGDVQHLRKDSLEVPLYVAGFWFDSITRASFSLNQEPKTLYKRIKDGNIEQKNNKVGISGEENHMFGRTGFSHHRSKAVEIDGVIYGSISQAAQLSDFTKKMIYNRLKNNTPGFAWVE